MNLVHFTLWNYNPHNDNSHGDLWNGEDFSIYSKPKSKKGPSTHAFENSAVVTGRTKSATKLDSDPSKVYVRKPDSAFDLIERFFEEMTAHHVGGRALDAIVRPYAAKIAGVPIYSVFDFKRLAYELVFITPKVENVKPSKESSTEAHVTEIYVPHYHFGVSVQPEVVVSNGNWLFDPKRQSIYWTINPTDDSPVPNSKGAPVWISCPKSAATSALKEMHNFHTIQIFKSKALVSQTLSRSINTIDSPPSCNLM